MKTLNKAQIAGLGEQLAPVGRTARIFKLQVELMPNVEDALDSVFKACQDEFGKSGDISPELDAKRIELIRVTALLIAQQVFDAPALNFPHPMPEPMYFTVDGGQETTVAEFVEANAGQIPASHITEIMALVVGERRKLGNCAHGDYYVKRTR
jgi:hypothetical protein